MNASRKISSLLFFVLTVLCFAVPLAMAQRAPRGGSVNIPPTRRPDQPTTIEVQITGADSRHLEMQVAVELISNSRPMGNRTFTNTDGRASFSVTTSGNYQVRVSGPSVEETTSDTFWVQPGELSHREYVAVKLKNPNGNNPAMSSDDSTVSASQLNVPDKARKEYVKGMDAFQKQDWKKASEHLEKATHDYANFDWAYNSLGVVYMNLGEKDQARSAFQRAVDINGRNEQAERNLARMLINDGEYAKAEDLAKRSLIAHPQDADGLTLQGFAQLKQGKVDEALASVRKVHTSEKHAFPFCHLIAAHALEMKNMKPEAAAEYKLYLAESPDAPETQAKLARDGLQRTSH